ncbi:hypothetical protein DCAR_0832519 [Daucus carota subsp. sativus]|uniref:Condensin II complex subunit H2 N-terminal domain-containing protein n=1 Tax=Daucus carota subsp. sativus TaxID=79200 RepID=A0A175YPZ6_DAUCS|nr:PREDICTED: uncharacterized protein LOC108198704 [Daucus carota subsp. sativus]WOH13010.1 hypothetical protein DCAR_0832519 [Daucus carota subsp. sativus]
MSQDKGKSSNSNHVNEFRHREKEFDSVLNVIRDANIDPRLICLKKTIGETDNGDSEFHSTGEFQKRLTEMCNKEINEDSVNFDFDPLSMCGKDIITENYGSINFDKAGILLESSAQVYSDKVDHLHALVLKTAKSIREGGLTEGPKYVPEQEEEDEEDMEETDLEDEGLDDIGDGEKLKSSKDSPLAKMGGSEKEAEPDARVSVEKQQIKQDLEDETNDGKVDLKKSDTADGESPSEESFAVLFLRKLGKRQHEEELEASKRRAVSQVTEVESKDFIGSSGKENLKPLSSTPTSKNDNSPLSD